MSACDTCSKPGACCRGFGLQDHTYYRTPLEALVKMVEFGLPFLPVDNRYEEYLAAIPEKERDFVRPFSFNCPMLGHDGRCTIYDHRPELCKKYEPLSDPLCVMWQPNPGEGDPKSYVASTESAST